MSHQPHETIRDRGCDATVGYYAVGLDNLLGERQNIRKPLLLHIATRDKFSSPEAQARPVKS